MDLSAISTTAVFGSAVGQELERSEPVSAAKPDGTREAEQSHRIRGHHRHHGRALGIFRQELKLVLSASFRTTFAASQPSYSETKGGATPDEVATDTIGTAQRIVSEDPVASSRALITFRHKVEEAASFVREAVGEDDSIADVDKAVGLVNEGLDGLETEAAKNVQSSATVLAVDTRSRQRSTIRIRTQEGDVVRLDLKRTDKLSATDISISAGDVVASATQVEVSSRSRMVLRVDGDLNDAELAAIQNVFAQAETMADDFFGGDLMAAFDLAAGFEYDTDQLARVKLRFRNRQVSNISYAAIGTALPEPTGSTGPITPEAGTDVAPAESSLKADVADSPAAAPKAPEESRRIDEPVGTTKLVDAAPDETAFLRFFEMLVNFLSSVADGFESHSAINGATVKYHYSQSFKLEILKSVFEVVAPRESADTVANTVSLIDNVANAEESEQDD